MEIHTVSQGQYQMKPVHQREPEHTADGAIEVTTIATVPGIGTQTANAEAVPAEGAEENKAEHLTEEEEKALADIASNISSLQDTYTKSFIEIGRLLIEAKRIHGKYGYWQKWVENKLDFSLSKAQRLIRIAKRFPNTAPVSHLDYTKAAILTRIPDQYMEEFGKFMKHRGYECAVESLMESMSKRRLEDAVRSFLKSKCAGEEGPHSDIVESTSTSVSEDLILKQIEDVQSSMNELLELMNVRQGDPEYALLASQLQQVCEDALSKLSHGM